MAFTVYNNTNKDIELQPNVPGSRKPRLIEAFTYETFEKHDYLHFSWAIRNLINSQDLMAVAFPFAPQDPDVPQTPPKNGQVLAYNSSTNTWEPKTLTASGAVAGPTEVEWADVQNKPELYNKTEIDAFLDKYVEVGTDGKIDEAVLPDKVVKVNSSGKIDTALLPVMPSSGESSDLPASNSSMAGYILTVNNSGNAEWFDGLQHLEEVNGYDKNAATDKGKVLTINDAGKPEWKAPEAVAPAGGVTSFKDLTEGFDISDKGGNFLKIKSDGSGFEAAAGGSGASRFEDLEDVNPLVVPANNGKVFTLVNEEIAVTDLPKKVSDLEDGSQVLKSENGGKYLAINSDGTLGVGDAPKTTFGISDITEIKALTETGSAGGKYLKFNAAGDGLTFDTGTGSGGGSGGGASAFSGLSDVGPELTTANKGKVLTVSGEGIASFKDVKLSEMSDVPADHSNSVTGFDETGNTVLPFKYYKFDITLADDGSIESISGLPSAWTVTFDKGKKQLGIEHNTGLFCYLCSIYLIPNEDDYTDEGYEYDVPLYVAFNDLNKDKYLLKNHTVFNPTTKEVAANSLTVDSIVTADAKIIKGFIVLG